MSVILATYEAEIRRITVRSQLRQIVCETYLEKPFTNKTAGRVAQDISPELKPQYNYNKKKSAI
jgi:hypothetical protein